MVERQRSSRGRHGPVALCSRARYGQYVKTIPQRELRSRSAKVIEAVLGGETFVVTRNGEPVAELRPVSPARRTFISRADVAALAATRVRIDDQTFRADLDRVIEQAI